MPQYTLNAKNQSIHTDFAGTISLLNYYTYAKQFKNCWVNLNFDGINYIEANLCAYLFGIIYHLQKTRGVRTYIEFKSLGKDLNILMRNGFTNYVAGKQNEFSPFDARDTTIPLKSFIQNDADGYCNYIERDFLHQRGLSKIKFADKDRIIESYLEIFDNVGLHANTSEPIFVCGQFFPSLGEVKFTLVDLGDGFLKKIAEYTKNGEKIVNASGAVSWAIKGNSTKKDAVGGTGLKNIFWFCHRNGGSLHIFTDDCYYDLTEQKATSHRIPNAFCGTTIHLIFRFLNN